MNFFQRQEPALARIDAAAEQIRDPDVERTVALFTTTTKERNELRHLIAERDREIEIMHHQLDFYKAELTKAQNSRNRWQRYGMKIATRLSGIGMDIERCMIEAREEAEQEPATERPDAQSSAAALEAALNSHQLEEPQS